MSPPLRVAVVAAGLTQPSSTRLLADRIVSAVEEEASAQGRSVVFEVVEVRGLAHAVVDALLTGFPSTDLAGAFASVVDADALVAVTPVFNASYSGLFKSFFDALPEEALAGKPVLLAATAGTPRHSLVLEHSLRPLFGYLHATVVPTMVFAAAEDWGSLDAGALQRRVERSASELVSLLSRSPSRRSEPGVLDEVTPFADLLRAAAPPTER